MMPLPPMLPGTSLALTLLQAPGYGRTQSALDPAGVQASRIHSLWYFLLVAATTVVVLVVAATLWAALRRRARPDADAPLGPLAPLPDEAEELGRERRATHWVLGSVVASVAVLLLFLVVDFSTGRALAQVPGADDALTITVNGHQWWWEATYHDPVPARQLTTANEIHIPVGRPVKLKLVSADVIHSFWVPSLHGKRDLIPGHEAITMLRADRPGTYRGACAEFCGHQHAKMLFTVVAQPPDEFARWYERQLQPAPAAATPERQAGQQVFLTKGCVLCHTIRGTPAGGQAGPELTHLASRGTIAAGSLPNTRGHLAGWIVDPQRIKPGVRMPANQLSPDELQSLLAYLESLR